MANVNKIRNPVANAIVSLFIIYTQLKSLYGHFLCVLYSSFWHSLTALNNLLIGYFSGILAFNEFLVLAVTVCIIVLTLAEIISSQGMSCVVHSEKESKLICWDDMTPWPGSSDLVSSRMKLSKAFQGPFCLEILLAN